MIYINKNYKVEHEQTIMMAAAVLPEEYYIFFWSRAGVVVVVVRARPLSTRLQLINEVIIITSARA